MRRATRLGRFRISATTAEGEIPLGQPESIAAVLATPKANRTEESKQAAGRLRRGRPTPKFERPMASLAAAKAAVPPDTILVALEKRKTELSKPTADDPAWCSFAKMRKQSTKQFKTFD